MNVSSTLTIARHQFYWLCQLGGWLLYIAFNAFYLYSRGEFTGNDAFGLTMIFLFGIVLTQVLRWIILKLDWLKLPVLKVIPRVLAMNIAMGAVLMVVYEIGFSSGAEGVILKLDWRLAFGSLLYAAIFFVWSTLYFLAHFLENYKKAEIEALRWQAAIRETELNKLRSQLNPHFMFNAMNSIRALVGENPQRSKEAITQLANLLRNTLQMGRTKLIPLGQELDVVRDYVALEAVRLEERLRVKWTVGEGAESMEVPPLMVQTLVENGIKHGIAKLPEGGELSFEALVKEDGLSITIRNSGTYDAAAKPESGFGMRNTLERLELLYNGRAKFSIANEKPGTVITQLFIPAYRNEN
jgi:two-component system, LytTR family, sensor kinase